MPQLDVSFVTQDPMLADVFNVTRQVQTIDAHGRVVKQPEEPFLALVGVVTQQDPADLMKRDDEQHVPKRIFVAAVFAFRNASKTADGLTQYQPDVIRWPVGPAGENLPDSIDYVVKQVYPYSRYGRGVYECVAESQSATDVVQ